MSKGKLFVLLNIVVPILLGTLIYILSGDNTVYSFLIKLFAGKISIPVLIFPRFIRNYLCDALWAYSLLFALFAANQFQIKCLKKQTLVAILFVIVFEIIQLYLPTFTFDIWDIGIEVVFIILARLLIDYEIY